jgi:hypothetical protein
MAAVAAYSPTVADAHGQAERLAVLLRGDPRAEVIGILSEAASLSEWIVAHSLSPESKRPLLAAAANVHAYVRLALDSVADASRDRTLVGATQSLLRAYAFLAAAWAQPIDGIGVPGLEAVLRAFGVLDPPS